MSKEQRPFLSPLEFAQLMGVTREHVYHMLKEGKIPFVRIGRAVRIHRDVVRTLIRKGTTWREDTGKPPRELHGAALQQKLKAEARRKAKAEKEGGE